jgi:hypothetical protein
MRLVRWLPLLAVAVFQTALGLWALSAFANAILSLPDG